MRLIDDTAAAREALAVLFADARRAVFFTGAGISTESGIPDFRSPGGIWSRMQPIYFDDFLRSEKARLEDWRRRFDMFAAFAAAEPNAAHLAIARLIDNGTATAVITQNIDGLHQRAGVPPDRLIELHGNGSGAECLDCGAAVTLADARSAIEATGRSPRCARCGGLVKARVVSFGQPMPDAEMLRAQAATLSAELFVVAGSSLVVYPAAGFPLMARRNGAQLVICNRDPTECDDLADIVVRGSLGAAFAGVAHPG